MEIKRDIYLDKLIRKKKNGLIKVVTGVRRCRKSYLLFHLFHNHLLNRPLGFGGVCTKPIWSCTAQTGIMT